jgi:hypothetical protein
VSVTLLFFMVRACLQKPWRRQGRHRRMEHMFVFETFWIGEALALRGIAKAFPVLPSRLIKSKSLPIVIFDPKKRWVLRPEQMHTTAKWTPYAGMEINGGVETTIVRGMLIYHQASVVGEKGYGAFITPNLL